MTEKWVEGKDARRKRPKDVDSPAGGATTAAATPLHLSATRKPNNLFADWINANRDFGIECLVVIGPDPFAKHSVRTVVAAYPDAHLHSAGQLAISNTFAGSWREVHSPLVAWWNLFKVANEAGMQWTKPWIDSGMQSVVRVDIPLPLNRGFECYMFTSQTLKDRSQAESIAWRVMSAWPIFKSEVLAKRYDISPRELQVIKHTAEGATAAEAGIAMEVSTRTVQFHLNNVMHKLQAPNRVAAVMRACWSGII